MFDKEYSFKEGSFVNNISPYIEAVHFKVTMFGYVKEVRKKVFTFPFDALDYELSLRDDTKRREMEKYVGDTMRIVKRFNR